MPCGRLRLAKRMGCGRRQSGQGLVEFALVGSLFFFLVFSIVNAGFFLYGRNAVQHSADVGAAALAALGDCNNDATNCPGGNADSVTISRMASAGLKSTPLINVTEIDVIKEDLSGTSYSDDTTGCGGSPGCINKYDVNGNAIGSVRWQPSARSVCSSCSGGVDYVRLVIKYTYHLLVGSTTFSLSTSNVFALEPQS